MESYNLTPTPVSASRMKHRPAQPARCWTVLSRQLALTTLMIFSLTSAAADSLNVQVLVSSYHGYQVSCFGMKDGWINLTVTGGAPPYHYKWSNGGSTATASELAAGYYKVYVVDQSEQVATVEVTLEQPLPMKLDVDVYEYPNGYNLSCYDCFNGNASVVVMGGAAPFTVNWSDGGVGAVRFNLGPKEYRLVVTDANGCEGANTAISLRGPERSDWSMGGNAGTVPGTQYVGTSDYQDMVFKSNGQERMRLKADGTIKLWEADTTFGPLYRDWDGQLKIGDGPGTTFPPDRCFELRGMPYWMTRGNDFTQLCPDQEPVLGTLDNSDLNIVTGGVQRLRITRNGAVGIGTDPPTGVVGNYRLFVEDGIATRDVLVKLGAWPDYVFAPEYLLMPLDQFRKHVQEKLHLPGIPSAAELEAQGGVELGAMQARLLKALEEQALYILQLEERLRALEQDPVKRKR